MSHVYLSGEPENDAFRTWVTVVWGRPPDPLADNQLDTYDYGIGGVKRLGSANGRYGGPLNAPTIQNPGNPGSPGNPWRIIGRPAGLLSTPTIRSSEDRDLLGTPFRDPDGPYGTLTGWVASDRPTRT